jgi:hypothetical protein
MKTPENSHVSDPLEQLKRAALISLILGCSGSFLLGVTFGLILSN